eukprot:3934161-Rhodomonas_salina.1
MVSLPPTASRSGGKSTLLASAASVKKYSTWQRTLSEMSVPGSAHTGPSGVGTARVDRYV